MLQTMMIDHHHHHRHHPPLTFFACLSALSPFLLAFSACFLGSFFFLSFFPIRKDALQSSTYRHEQDDEMMMVMMVMVVMMMMMMMMMIMVVVMMAHNVTVIWADKTKYDPSPID